MNHHLPFDSLFEDPNELAQDELESLMDHISDCEVCRSASVSLQTIDESLRTAEMVSPAAGFSARWEVRYAEMRNRAHRRQIIFVGSGLTTALILMGVLLISRILPFVQSPGLLFLTWISRLLALYSYLGSIAEFTRAVVGVTPTFLPWLVWIISFGLLGSFTVLSLVSYRLFAAYKGS